MKSGGNLQYIEFVNESFDDKLKEMLKQDHMKEYYSNVSFLVPKYGIEELHSLYKKYS